MMATIFKFSEFKLNENENKVLADQSDDVASEFFPNIQSGWIKLIIFVASFLGIFGAKYLKFIEAENKKKKDDEKKTDIKAKPDIQLYSDKKPQSAYVSPTL